MIRKLTLFYIFYFSTIVYANSSIVPILQLILDSDDGQEFVPVVATPPRNIIYIMLDDADFYDFGYNRVNGSSFNTITPHMNSLRQGGMLLKNFYSGSSICSPTRASVLTGNSPLNYGLDYVWPQVYTENDQYSRGLNAIPNASQTIHLGQEMKKLGLTTIHYGKWHVGSSRSEYLPSASGWDEYEIRDPVPGQVIGRTGTYDVYRETGRRREHVYYLDSWQTDNIVADIHAKAQAGKRFFINFWPHTPHKDYFIPPGFNNSSYGFDLTTDRGKVQAMMVEMDNNVGKIIDALRANNIFEDTLIVITSDNGGHRDGNNPDRYSLLSGDKVDLSEGGIKVSAVFHWPNQIPANSTNDSMMTTLDLLPTFMELLGSENINTIDAQLDGNSKAPVIANNVDGYDVPIIWQTSWYTTRQPNTRWRSEWALRQGQYKLIKFHFSQTANSGWRLYDIVRDPGEFNNLKNQKPALFRQMKEAMTVQRLQSSRFYQFPTVTQTKRTIRFDPRLNSHSSDLTFAFDIQVPETLSEHKVIYDHPGQLTIRLLTSRKIQVRFYSVHQEFTTRTSEVLLSNRLSAGKHRVVFGIESWRNDTSQFELYVDGVFQDKQDSNLIHRTPWSSVSDASLGHSGINLSCIRWYKLKFYPDELIYDALDCPVN